MFSFVGMSMLLIIVVLLVSGILSVEIAYGSELAQWVKQFLFIDGKRLHTHDVMRRPLFWIQVFGKWSFLLFPVIILLVINFNIFYFLTTLLECELCTSFWVAVGLMLLSGHAVSLSFLIAPLALPCALLYNKLRDL